MRYINAPGFFIRREIMLAKIKDFAKQHWQILLFEGILIICVGVYINSLLNRLNSAEQTAKAAQTMTAEQTQNVNDLQNDLNISEPVAEQLKDAIAKAQSNTVQPQVSFTVQASTPTTAVNDVAQRIDGNDTSLPPATLENTDKTVVADQPDNQDYRVGVYKINLKKNYYVGTGVGVSDGKVYVPVSIQRNYDKAHAISVQANIDTQGKVNGGQVMWQVGF